MKPIRWWGAIAGSLLAGAAAAIELQSAAGVDFVSGGVGEEERAEMQLVLPDYSLKITTVARSGQYLSGVEVELRGIDGAPVLKIVTDGPWLLARLPPGRYELRLSYEGIAQTRQVSIPQTGRRELVVRWEEPATP